MDAYQSSGFAYQNSGFAYQSGAVTPVVKDDIPSAGNIDWLKKKKKKGKVLRYSDFEGIEQYQQALAQAMAEASMPIRKISDPVANEYSEFFGDEEDDEILLKALFLITRH